MRSTLPHKALSSMLAVVLLMEGTVMHGNVHAHADGGVPHTHADNGPEGHSGVPHSHDGIVHEHADSDHEFSSTQVVLPANRVKHTHISLLGFDFTTTEQEDSQDRDDTANSQSFFCITSDCATSVCKLASVGKLFQQLMISDVSCGITREQTAVSRLPQVFSAPLCDSARFERSGVLLA